MILTIHQICHAGKRKCFYQEGLYSSNRFLHYNANICTAIEVATMLGFMFDMLEFMTDDLI